MYCIQLTYSMSEVSLCVLVLLLYCEKQVISNQLHLYDYAHYGLSYFANHALENC